VEGWEGGHREAVGEVSVYVGLVEFLELSEMDGSSV
jgi:hypothetical protein